jgi:hypothetical protein
MASPITTSGFAIQERLNPQYLDPRQLAPRYDAIIPALGQGLGVAGQFAQLYDEAQMRPIRQRLQQLQIQEAEGRAALRPLEQQRRRIELSQPIERVVGGGISSVPRFSPIQSVGDDGQVITETPAGEDIFSVEEVEVTDPVTGRKSVAQRRTRPLLTMEQADNQQSLIESREAAANAATERLRLTGERDAAKAENDRIKADASRVRAELLASNPGVSYVDVKREDGRTIRQYFPKGEPGRIIHEIDRGELGAEDFLTTLLRQQTRTAGVPAAPSSDFAGRANSILGQGRNLAAPDAPSDRFVAGQVYTDSSGAKAEYLGNGRWKEIP